MDRRPPPTTGSPSTVIACSSGSTRSPRVAGRPSTSTRPAATSSSAPRRDATPAAASTFEIRSGGNGSALGVGGDGRSLPCPVLGGRGTHAAGGLFPVDESRGDVEVEQRQLVERGEAE